MGENNPNFYKGKKVILVNEMPQSSAEFMSIKYRCAPNSIILGSITAGADGRDELLEKAIEVILNNQMQKK